MAGSARLTGKFWGHDSRGAVPQKSENFFIGNRSWAFGPPVNYEKFRQVMVRGAHPTKKLFGTGLQEGAANS
jgi:hypothetical protein